MPFDMHARIDEWTKSLLDTTKRNRLINFTAGRSGGVAIVSPSTAALWQRLVLDGQACTFLWKRDVLGLPPEAIDGDANPSGAEFAGDVESATVARPRPPAGRAFPFLAPNVTRQDAPAPKDTPPAARPRTLTELTAECLASPRLEATDLLTAQSDKKLAADLLRLARGASEAETDHGVTTLYAAFGFLRWYESVESDEPILAPLVLVPVRLARASVQAPWTLRAEDDDPTTNHCLAELLANDFKLPLPAGPDSGIDTDGPDGLTGYLGSVARLVESMPRWGVVPEVALGVFNFQKLAMWRDLKKNAARIVAHRLCRAIGGDAGVALRPPAGLVAAAELDERVPPDGVTHILDADSSQHEAIEAVKRGADVVIDGPPGTGKSQTIANAIAELLAAGRTVLFVSEKTAALEVVKRRLDARGLGEFCLELHSHKANKRVVAAELGQLERRLSGGWASTS